MRSQTPSLAASLPTRLSTQLSFQPSRTHSLPSPSLPSLSRFPRHLIRNSSYTRLTTSRIPPDENFTMAGPIRTSHERVEGYNPMGQHPQAQPSGSNSGEKQPVRISRPPNPWILYRKDKLVDLMNSHPEHKKLPQAELSKLISTMWRSESAVVRQHYELQADIAKEQHQKDFPEYQYRPMKKADKDRLREEKRQEKEREKEAKQRAKQLQQQVRDGPRRSPYLQVPATPVMLPPGTPMPPSMLAGQTAVPAAPLAQQPQNTNQVQQLMLMRYGITGPSPPVSECPSPNGSPLLPLIDQIDSGSSRSSSLSLPQNGRGSATPTPPPGAHDASFASTSLAAPQPSAPLRPPSASAFHFPSTSTQDASRPASTVQPQKAFSPWTPPNPLADESGSFNPGQSDDQGDQFMDWMDPSYLQDPSDGMFNFNMLSDTNLNAPFSSEGELSFNNDDTATHAMIQQTINPNIFALSIPTASFDNPPGEIQVSTANQYAESANAFGSSGLGNDLNLDIQSLLAEFGLDSLTSGIFSPEQNAPGVQVEGPDQRNNLAQLVDGLVEMNTKAQQHGMLEAVADHSLNVQAGFGAIDGLGLDSFIAPASLMGALPSPPESSTAGSQAAQSPYDMSTVQPTNLGASGSGQYQMNHTQMYAQGPTAGQGQGQKFGEASHPTPPASAGPVAPSPHPTHDGARTRPPAPTHSHSAPGYVPPSGAANATRRRAAGSWRPPS